MELMINTVELTIKTSTNNNIAELTLILRYRVLNDGMNIISNLHLIPSYFLWLFFRMLCRTHRRYISTRILFV